MTKLQNLIKDLTNASERLREAARLKFTPINRDAVIQRFEFCFELSWKVLQEYIKDQGLDCKSPRNCLRIAAELNLITNLKNWFDYLEARNLIAHTYNESLSNRIYKKAVDFSITNMC
ncbi:MAG: nucleotidyltransferase substrate binding protein, partial [Actinobacteria bacterium]|nr:nucleotidyltransferase substrate binding protein [Actinomycetota bacterium]